MQQRNLEVKIMKVPTKVKIFQKLKCRRGGGLDRFMGGAPTPQAPPVAPSLQFIMKERMSNFFIQNPCIPYLPGDFQLDVFISCCNRSFFSSDTFSCFFLSFISFFNCFSQPASLLWLTSFSHNSFQNSFASFSFGGICLCLLAPLIY